MAEPITQVGAAPGAALAIVFDVPVKLGYRIGAALGDAGPAHGRHAGHPATGYVVAEATVVNRRVKRGIRIGVAAMAVWRGFCASGGAVVLVGVAPRRRWPWW